MPLTGRRFTGTSWVPFLNPGNTITPPTGSGDDAAREAMTDWGSYRPTTLTAGLMPSTNKATMTTKGATSYSTNNATVVTIKDIKFTGKVSITGRNYRFKNCWFACSTDTPVQCTNANAYGLVFEDCLFEPVTPSLSTGIGIVGHHFTLKRCRMRWTEDLIRPQLSGGGDLATFIYGCYLSELLYTSPNPQRSDDDDASHCDIVQLGGGYNINFVGNELSGFYTTEWGNADEPSVDDGSNHISGNKFYPYLQTTSVLMGTPLNSPTGDITFDQNWIGGGAYCLNFASGSQVDRAIYVTNNIWTDQPRVANAYVRAAASLNRSLMHVTGNTRLSDGSAQNTIGVS